jgi:hypothetical protein
MSSSCKHTGTSCPLLFRFLVTHRSSIPVIHPAAISYTAAFAFFVFKVSIMDGFFVVAFVGTAQQSLAVEQRQFEEERASAAFAL